MSTRRLAKPHSLSYQPSTFTVRPLTAVNGASKIVYAGLPTMSLETIGASLYARTSLSSPCAAAA